MSTENPFKEHWKSKEKSGCYKYLSISVLDKNVKNRQRKIFKKFKKQNWLVWTVLQIWIGLFKCISIVIQFKFRIFEMLFGLGKK